jgi:hypothetical protein
VDNEVFYPLHNYSSKWDPTRWRFLSSVTVPGYDEENSTNVFDSAPIMEVSLTGNCWAGLVHPPDDDQAKEQQIKRKTTTEKDEAQGFIEGEYTIYEDSLNPLVTSRVPLEVLLLEIVEGAYRSTKYGYDKYYMILGALPGSNSKFERLGVLMRIMVHHNSVRQVLNKLRTRSTTDPRRTVTII